MIVLATLIEAFATILHTVINIYIWVIIIAALITFVRPDPYNPIVQILSRLTNPVYSFIRKLVPTLIMISKREARTMMPFIFFPIRMV